MSILPNSTPLPHIIIREWMPLLKDIELRILLVVADQTLGWIEDRESGRRKEKDWISHYQMRSKIKKRAGKPAGSKSVSQAISKLVDEYGIIEALNESGDMLDSSEKRMKNGGKIFYRLNLKKQATLFDDPRQKEQGVPSSKTTLVKRTTYKRNSTYKRNDIFVDEKSPTPETPKKPSKHKLFVDFWFDQVKRTRGMEPIITKADAANLKRVIDLGIEIDILEQCSIFFLADVGFRTFSPTISTFTSSGILNGLMNRVRNDPDFWKKMDRYTGTYLQTPPAKPRAPLVIGDDEERTNGLKRISFALESLTKAFTK